MSKTTFDAVIIGGGMAGLCASIHLLEKGLKVALVSKGDPVISLSTGCIDLLGSTPDPMDGLDMLPEEHPYRLVGSDGIVESIETFKRIMAETGLDYVGDAHTNRKILTPLGTTKTTCLVPETIMHSEFSDEKYLHLISFDGIKDFYPSYITSRKTLAGYSTFDAGVSTTMAIASRFEEKRFLDEFISWLKALEVPPGKIALPAVLGIESSKEIISRISRETDRKIFEIPTLPPSIPGIRLFRRLKNLFQAKGGYIYWGNDVASFETTNNHIEAITLSTPGRPHRVGGRAFMLSTGSFVSGGLFAHRDSIRETVFGMDVYLPGPRQGWFTQDFFARDHEIEKAGIRVDKAFRPIDSDMENLFVCGSILAFSQVMKYQCGNGLALSTGFMAAKSLEASIS